MGTPMADSDSQWPAPSKRRTGNCATGARASPVFFLIVTNQDHGARASHFPETGPGQAEQVQPAQPGDLSKTHLDPPRTPCSGRLSSVASATRMAPFGG